MRSSLQKIQQTISNAVGQGVEAVQKLTQQNAEPEETNQLLSPEEQWQQLTPQERYMFGARASIGSAKNRTSGFGPPPSLEDNVSSQSNIEQDETQNDIPIIIEEKLENFTKNASVADWNKLEKLPILKVGIDQKKITLVKALCERQHTLLQGLDSDYLQKAAKLAAANNDAELLFQCMTYKNKLPNGLAPILVEAAIAGQEEMVNQLLAQGASLDEKVANDQTVLQAIRANRNSRNKNLISNLVKKNLDEGGNSVRGEFIQGLEKGDEKAVKEILEDGFPVDFLFVNNSSQITPLTIAVFCEYVTIVKLLLEYGAQVDISITLPNATAPTTPYLIAWNNKNNDLVKLLAPESKEAWANLLAYLQKGEVESVRYALEHGLAALMEKHHLLRTAVQCHFGAIGSGDEDVKNNIEIIIDDLIDKYHIEPCKMKDGKSAYELAVELPDEYCIKKFMANSKEVKNNIFQSAASGDAVLVKSMIGFGFDKNAINDKKQTLLDVAMANDKVEVAKILLESNVDPVATVDPALAVARKEKKNSFINLLIPYSHQAKLDLIVAARNGQIKEIERLIKAGVDEKAALLEMLETYDDEESEKCLRAFLKMGFNPDTEIEKNKTLLQAVRDSKKKACRELLTPASKKALEELHKAISDNQDELIEQLLEDGVDPDKQINGSSNGLSALDVAKNSNCSATCNKLLISYSEDAMDQLFFAAQKDNSEKVKEWLELGVDRHAAMSKAILKNHTKCVQVLLECGFNPDLIVNARDYSFLQFAREEKKPECVKLLISKSNVAKGKLNAAVFNHNFDAVEQLLEEGAHLSISKENEINFKQYNYLIEARHARLNEILKVNKEVQNKVWSTGGDNTKEHTIILDLDFEIKEFKQANSKKENAENFINALQQLRDDLRQSINKQRKKLDVDSRSYIVASETVSMLQKLRIPKKELCLTTNDEYKTYQLGVLAKYEDKCKETARWTKYLRAALIVIFAGVGFVLGATVGMVAGMLLGSWSGPGAFVTAAAGFIAGGITGAMIAVTAVASALSLSAAAGSGVLMFKSWGYRKQAEEVAELGNRFVAGG